MSNISFVKSIVKIEQKPKLKLPELVLCGRSNVGKSSFINSLFNRKDLAKVSSSPGKTRTINYFSVHEKFYLVDLPGFGFAKVSQKEKEKWQKSITEFLSKSNEIKYAFHLIDSRHQPTALDEMLNEFLINYNIDFKIILTKVDKLNQSEKSKVVKNLQAVFPDFKLNEDIFLYSSLKGTGKNEMKKFIQKEFSVKL
ncbi:MAG: YihA family ribosome biogenesis GTP-binding protein [Ignavibacteria bacterium]|nr:MAG: YihA family ribosome biogenesis GTP-binding protein [Ignavibacteria bacterium]